MQYKIIVLPLHYNENKIIMKIENYTQELEDLQLSKLRAIQQNNTVIALYFFNQIRLLKKSNKK